MVFRDSARLAITALVLCIFWLSAAGAESGGAGEVVLGPEPGPQAPPSEREIGMLAARLAGDDEAARDAQRALKALGPRAASAVDALAGLLSPGSAAAEHAAEVLSAIGPRAKTAAPALVKMLDCGDHAAERASATALGDVGADDPAVVAAMVARLAQSRRNKNETSVKYAVIEALGKLGPKASSASLAITLAMLDEDSRQDLTAPAIQALGRIGPGARVAAPVLRYMFYQEQSSFGARSAGPALARMGFADEIVPCLVKWAAKPQAVADQRRNDFHAMQRAAERIGALVGLGEMDPAAPQVLPTLLAALADDDVQVRQAAAAGLGHLRPVTPEALDALVSAIRKDGGVRKAAAEAIAAMGPGAAGAVAPLTALLAEKDDDIRMSAASALGGIGPAAAGAAAALAGTVKHSKGDARSAAAEALAAMGPQGARAAGVILEAMDASGGEQRWQDYKLGAALNKMAPHAAFLVPRLIDRIDRTDAKVRLAAISLLGLMGPAAEPAVPALAKASKDKDPAICAEAVAALGRIGPSSPAAVKACTQAIYDDSGSVRLAAVAALEQMAAAAAASADDMAELLKDKDERVRRTAMRALAAIGKPAIGAIAKRLKDPSALARCAAAETLGRCGGDAGAIAPLLKDADAQARAGAARGLGALGAAAKEHCKTLAGLLEDEDSVVRAAAAEAALVICPSDPAVIAAVNKAVDLENNDKREMFAALRRLGPAAHGAFPAVLATLEKSPGRDNDGAILGTLVAIGPPGESDVPAIVGALEARNSTARAFAVEALLTLGPKSAPAADALVKVLLTSGRPNENASLDSAINVLRAMGKPAVPAILAALKQARDNQQYLLLDALKPEDLTGNDAPLLMAAVTGGFADPARKACLLLEQIGPPAADVVPELLKYFNSNLSKFDAARALLRIAPRDEKVIAAVLSAMNASVYDDKERLHAVGKRLRNSGDKAADGLIKLAKGSRREETKNAAILSLGYFPPDDKKIVPALIDLLKECRSDERSDIDERFVFRALAGQGEAADAAVPLLAQTAKDGRGTSDDEAVIALGWIATPRALAELKKLMKEQYPPQGLFDEQMARSPRADKVAAMLAENFSSGGGINPDSIKLLRTLRVPPKTYMPALTKGLSSQKPEERCLSLVALGNMGELAAPAVADIAKLLADSDYRVGAAAADSLMKIGPPAKSALPALKDLAGKKGKEEPDLVNAAASAVEAIDVQPGQEDDASEGAYPADAMNLPADDIAAHAKAVLPLLTWSFARGSHEFGTFYKVGVISRIGPAASQTVPDLCTLLRAYDGNQWREQIAAALGAIGNTASSALPHLRRTLASGDLNDGARKAIQAAIAKISNASPAAATQPASECRLPFDDEGAGSYYDDMN